MSKDKLQIGDFVRNRFTKEVGRIVEISRKDTYIVEYDNYLFDKQAPDQFELCLEPTSSASSGTISTILSFQTTNNQ